MIVFKNVHKHYGPLHVLNDVSFRVEPGEVVVICGPSGSGKSTLLRCINRLERIDSGEITVDGMRVDDATPQIAKIRAEIGMVFQQFNLYPHLRVLENLTLAPLKVRGMSKEQASATARKLLAKVGIPEKEAAYPSQLSGGQQQRVAIARALAMKPAVLLCDEITSALDPELVSEVLRVVEGLAAEGMTLMLVTHEMRFARDVGTKLVFMHQGRVHEEGPPKALFAAPRTPELNQFVAAVM